MDGWMEGGRGRFFVRMQGPGLKKRGTRGQIDG